MFSLLRATLTAMALAGAVASSPPVFAAHTASAPGEVVMETIARHAILIDLKTHTVLFDKGADERMPPASMSKLMTAYMLFERLKQGGIPIYEPGLEPIGCERELPAGLGSGPPVAAPAAWPTVPGRTLGAARPLRHDGHE